MNQKKWTGVPFTDYRALLMEANKLLKAKMEHQLLHPDKRVTDKQIAQFLEKCKDI